MMPAIETVEYGAFSRRLFERSYAEHKPLRGQIELTYACNVRCVHCYTDCFNNPQDIKNEMSTEKILNLVDEMHEAGCLWLCLTGGEIFMRKDFFTIYDYCLEKGFLLTLFTNATMVTEGIADRLAANPPFVIETSCHGLGKTFDAVTQVKGSFERFDRGLKLLLNRCLRVEVKTKALALNRGKLEEIRAYVEGLGLTFHLSSTIHPDLKGSQKTIGYALTPEEIVDLEIDEEKLKKIDFCELQKAVLQEPLDNLHRCGCGTNYFAVGGHGRLATCVMNRQVEKDLNSQPFEEAFFEMCEEVRAIRFRGNSPCRTCTITSLCEKKPATFFLGGEDPEAPVRHFCDTAHLKARKMGFDVKSPFET